MKLYLSEDGLCHADFPAPLQVIASFLEEDVQHSVEVCDYVLDQIHQIRTGLETQIDGAGNAHNINLQKSGVRIDHLWTDQLPSAFLSLDEFEEIIRRWREFISGHPSRHIS